MKHYLISDDSYFLLGAQAILSNNYIAAETINISRQPVRSLSRSLCRGDIVIIAVDDVCIRRKLIEAASSVSCRIVFMPAFCHVTAALRELPWVVPRQVDDQDFMQIIHQLSATPLFPWRMKDEHLMIMESFCRPELPAGILFIKNMTTRNLSQRKRALLKKHGLSESNCHGTLLCRDILFLRKKYQDKQQSPQAAYFI
ncbi:hypothetical protein [Entomohabitans teleogrylli]|uniref:hypothetical protein n=1 Tax=Entomohabitans teleogrylli TaxID=1384589 RepID=UPI00073D8959|nr:hypothetical protein [Entomohabitans teleogrylli]